ncbi:MAG: hypothetical protein CMI09_15145 [Oceanospirillaceae bacterium]|nr:hypothetical protein [Oceanospirillaceae bacterium]
MNANIFSFPSSTSLAVTGTAAMEYSASDQIERLEQLEHSLRNSLSDACLRRWLEEYIDIGLELADTARTKHQHVLQESWLKRLFSFLRDTAFRQDCRPLCRHLCLEYLYQPYFALRHVYQSDSNGEQKMRRINKDLEVIARYVL